MSEAETRTSPTPSSADLIRDDVDAVHVWAESLNREVLEIREIPVEEVAARLATLRAAIKLLRDSEAAMEHWIAEVFKDQKWRVPQEFEGVGTVEVKRSNNRRAWQHEDAQRAWFRAYMAERGGEVPPAAELLSDFRKAASVNGWKVTEFKRLGLDVDEFCDSQPAAPRVEITVSEAVDG